MSSAPSVWPIVAGVGLGAVVGAVASRALMQAPKQPLAPALPVPEVGEGSTSGMGLAGLAGKIALVTGGTGGIGSVVCRFLADDGMRVVVVDMDEAKCKRLAAELPTGTGWPRPPIALPPRHQPAALPPTQNAWASP